MRVSVSDEPLVAFAAAPLNRLHRSVNEAPATLVIMQLYFEGCQKCDQTFPAGNWNLGKKKKNDLKKKEEEKTLADTIT